MHAFVHDFFFELVWIFKLHTSSQKCNRMLSSPAVLHTATFFFWNLNLAIYLKTCSEVDFKGNHLSLVSYQSLLIITFRHPCQTIKMALKMVTRSIGFLRKVRVIWCRHNFFSLFFHAVGIFSQDTFTVYMIYFPPCNMLFNRSLHEYIKFFLPVVVVQECSFTSVRNYFWQLHTLLKILMIHPIV